MTPGRRREARRRPFVYAHAEGGRDVWRLAILVLVLALATVGCGARGAAESAGPNGSAPALPTSAAPSLAASSTPPASPPPAAPMVPVVTPAVALGGAVTAAVAPTAADDVAEAERRAAAAEIASYAERRKRPRAVIGGCEESCERPESALSALIDALTLATAERRVEALWGRVDYSQLVVDGEPRGEAWSALWQDVRSHRQREDEILGFLGEVAALRDQAVDPAAMSSLRGAGTVLRPVPGRSDIYEAQLRLPALRPGVRGEGAWRLGLVRRGWEWLLVELDRAPSRRPFQADRYSGSVATGRL